MEVFGPKKSQLNIKSISNTNTHIQKGRKLWSLIFSNFFSFGIWDLFSRNRGETNKNRQSYKIDQWRKRENILKWETRVLFEFLCELKSTSREARSRENERLVCCCTGGNLKESRPSDRLLFRSLSPKNWVPGEVKREREKEKANTAFVLLMCVGTFRHARQ